MSNRKISFGGTPGAQAAGRSPGRQPTRRVRGTTAAVLFSLLAFPTAAEGLSPAQEKAFREYLLANPQVIMESLHRYEQTRLLAQRAHEQQMVAEALQQLQATDDHPRAGDPGGAPFVEFFDYQCGYCKRMFPQMKTAMQKGSGLQVIFVEFPILGPESRTAAIAALAAARQNRYLQLHEALMAARGKLTEAGIMDIAAKVGLDIDRLRRDMADPKIEDHLNRNRALAEMLDIRGTPAFLARGHVARGALAPDDMNALMEAARAAP